MENQCREHTAHSEHLKRNDARIGALEDEMDEVQRLIVRIDTLVSSMNKMYWLVIAAVIGCLVTAVMTLITR